MAVLLVFFNFCDSTRIVQNILLVNHLFSKANIPFYIGELCLENGTPFFKKESNVFHFRSNSYMFYKENIIIEMEKMIPKQYSKICTIDSDIIFEDTEWYDKLSSMLNQFNVVQPFSEACFLSPEFTVLNSRVCSVKNSISIQHFGNIPEEFKSVWNFEETLHVVSSVDDFQLEEKHRNNFLWLREKQMAKEALKKLIDNEQMDSEYIFIKTPHSVCKFNQSQNFVNNKTTIIEVISGHEGFAWAFDRNWFQNVSFFDYSLVGAGDTFFAWNVLGLDPSGIFHSPYSFCAKEFMEYSKKKERYPVKISCLETKVYHLFHGTISNRQYRTVGLIAKDVLKKFSLSDISDAVYKDKEGIYRWKENVRKCINEGMQMYFSLRNDDGL